MSTVEQLQQSREFIRRNISIFPDILENNPDEWWRLAARKLISLREKLTNFPDEEIGAYFISQIEVFLEQLRSAIPLSPHDVDDFASLADHLIMNFSMEMAKPFENIELDVKTNHMSLQELIALMPDRFKCSNKLIRSEDCVILHVKHPTQNYFQDIPLPRHKKVWHKGGPARAVLDIVANAPISMQESEFPWNDFDAIVANKRRNKIAALNIGVDADGIEYTGEDDLDFSRYCAGRDTTQNQVCLGADGLYFSDDAYATAITGHTRIENEYVANKAIYGFDRMVIKGENLAKPRGLMRLIKAVVEGKALSFDYLPMNSNLDLGTHSLFLAKRWSKKEKFPEYLQRMHFLMRLMGQTRVGENDVFETLDRVHSQYPFFDFLSEVRTPVEVVRWKSRKLIKQIDREMGWKFQIPTNMKIQRTRGDNVPIFISLNNFHLNDNELDIALRWQKFLDRSTKRTKAVQNLNRLSYEKIFGNENSDGDPVSLGHEDV